MSHGHSRITIEDLQAEAQNGSAPKARQAAMIAASHVSELAGISTQTNSLQYALRDKTSISMKDLNWASDMNSHRTFDHTLASVASDIGIGSLATSFGGGGLAAGAEEISSGTSILGGAADAAKVFGWLGAGVAAIGIGGYAFYEAFHEHSKITKASNQDSLMFGSWLIPQSGTSA